MKKVINGKKYDTDTALELGIWENHDLGINYVLEVLYRKRTGEFFLYCEGGSNTKYSVQRGSNNWGSGQHIIPLDFKSAESWAKENLHVEIFEKYFGEVPEDFGKRIVSFSIPNDLYEKIKRASSFLGVGPSEFVSDVLESYMDSFFYECEQHQKK